MVNSPILARHHGPNTLGRPIRNCSSLSGGLITNIKVIQSPRANISRKIVFHAEFLPGPVGLPDNTYFVQDRNLGGQGIDNSPVKRADRRIWGFGIIIFSGNSRLHSFHPYNSSFYLLINLLFSLIAQIYFIHNLDFKQKQQK